jgi:hypothetical protein
MATVEFFDLPFDVIEIILTFLVMKDGCDGNQCLLSCLAFMSCCKQARSYVFRAKLSVKAKVRFNNIFDVPPRNMVNLLTRWGVEFSFCNLANYGDSESLVLKKHSSQNASILDVFPKLASLTLCNLQQLKGTCYDFTNFHESGFIFLIRSNLHKVNFGGCHFYRNITFGSCSSILNDSELVLTVSGGTFETIFLTENSNSIEHRLFPEGFGSRGIRHLIIENTGYALATVETLSFYMCESIEKITLRGGIKINRMINESGIYTVNPIHMDASNNEL